MAQHFQVNPEETSQHDLRAAPSLEAPVVAPPPPRDLVQEEPEPDLPVPPESAPMRGPQGLRNPSGLRLEATSPGAPRHLP